MYAPHRVMSNGELAQMVATSDEWIRTRTGIERRHVAAMNESSAQMATAAAQAALQVADADPREIDLIIVATSTPSHLMPSTACLVQDALGASKAGAFDLNAACSGFVYALTMGHQAIASGEQNVVLVVGVDTMTRTLDWKDRSTCVLFGDGAGAVLLRATEGSSGVLATILGSDGSGGELLTIPAGGSAMPACHETVDSGAHYLRMNGNEVFRFATHVMPQAVEQVAAKAGLDIMNDVSLIVPHQANLRIIEGAAKRLKLPLESFAVYLNEYGNTSAASVPIALCEAISAGRIRPGQNIIMVGFGAGLTWGAVAVRWGVPPEEAVSPKYRTLWRWVFYRWAGLRRTTRHSTIWLIRHLERRKNGNGHSKK